jgi:glycolate oxidase FAD binding subunit
VVKESGGLVAQSVEDVRSAVTHCVDEGVGLTPIGGGARQHVGHVSTKDCVPLFLGGLDKVVEYNPDDLVIVAESGVTFDSVQATLAKHGQWLPLDIAAPERQTLGGIVATRANSLIRNGFGTVRDCLIGTEVVNGSAEIVVGGGKVVKNVSGYDLPRLYCGSWGTLGVLTKTNFKVSPLPEADRSLLVILSNDRNAEELIDTILSKTTPASALLFNASAAAKLLGPDADVAQYLFVRYLGRREDVDELMARSTSAAVPFASSVIDLPRETAKKLSRLLADFSLQVAPLTATYHIMSSQVGAYARMVSWIASHHGLTADVLADTACGIVTAHFYAPDVEFEWLSFMPNFKDKADRVGGSLIVERMPQSWRMAEFPVWSPVLPDFQVMKIIKEKLDPLNVFNPGRFMGGI